MSAALEVPNRLPVNHLSYSSVRKLEQCPEAWRRHYLDDERDSIGARAVLGRALHASISLWFQAVIAAREAEKDVELDASDLLDCFATEFERSLPDVTDDLERAQAVTEKDQGIAAVSTYMRDIAPLVPEPKQTERRFAFAINAETEWDILGYIDLEHGPGVEGDVVADIKLKQKSMPQSDADLSFQPTLYVAERLTRGVETRSVQYHEIKALKTKNEGVVIETSRSERQVQIVLARIARAAREIEWRAATGDWSGAPDLAWWCGDGKCRYFNTCPLV